MDIKGGASAHLCEAAFCTETPVLHDASLTVPHDHRELETSISFSRLPPFVQQGDTCQVSSSSSLQGTPVCANHPISPALGPPHQNTGTFTISECVLPSCRKCWTGIDLGQLLSVEAILRVSYL